MDRLFGLIGKTLTHSFSQKYFREKFDSLQITDSDYLLFELEHIEQFPEVLERHPNLLGLNVTIPYKQAVIPFLHEMDPTAAKIGAINTIRIEKSGQLKGYNTDFYGFKESLEKWLKPPFSHMRALVLGTGGASKAVKAALNAMDISFIEVSRRAQGETIDYQMLNDDPVYLKNHHLIINTTPLGMTPNVDDVPELRYEQLDGRHYLYDLVYNPVETLFLKMGKENGAAIKNGLEMLHLQAEKAWEIWNAH